VNYPFKQVKDFTQDESMEKHMNKRQDLKGEIYKGEAAVFASFNLIQSRSPRPKETEQDTISAACQRENDI